MEEINCDVCGSSDRHILFKTKLKDGRMSTGGPLVKCNSCGMIYISSRIDKEKNYNKKTIEKLSKSCLWITDMEAHRNYWKRRLNDLEEHAPNKGKILDVGCFNGYFLDEARSNGWDVYGVEPKKSAAIHATDKLNLINVYNGTLMEANYPDNYFDVVTLYHVIEHLPTPSIVLQEISRIIKKDGLLVVEAPNCNFWMKIMRSKFRYLQPDHYWYFTRKTIYRILRQSGFQPFSFQHIGKTVVLNSMLKRWVGLYSIKLENFFSRIANLFGLGESLVYLNIGDIFITYSKRNEPDSNN